MALAVASDLGGCHVSTTLIDLTPSKSFSTIFRFNIPSSVPLTTIDVPSELQDPAIDVVDPLVTALLSISQPFSLVHVDK